MCCSGIPASLTGGSESSLLLVVLQLPSQSLDHNSLEIGVAVAKLQLFDRLLNNSFSFRLLMKIFQSLSHSQDTFYKMDRNSLLKQINK